MRIEFCLLPWSGATQREKRHLNNRLEITNSMGAKAADGKASVRLWGRGTRGGQSRKCSWGGDPSSLPLRHRAWELGDKVRAAAHHSHWVPVPELGPGALLLALSRCLEHPVCMVTGIPEAPPEAGRLPYQDLHLIIKVA